MKKFFIGLLKGLGYFGIYFGMQFLVSFVYGLVGGLSLVTKYIATGQSMQDPAVMERYMEEMMQLILDSAMPTVIISGLLTIGVVVLIFVCSKKNVTKALRLQPFHAGAVLPIVMMGLSFNVLTGLILSFIPEEAMSGYEQSSTAMFTGNFWVMVFGTVIVAPLVEEIIFRGLIYTRMKQGMSAIVAALLTSALFGVAHGQWVWMLYTFVFGLILIWVFERTKSLIANILLHFSYNLCAVLQMLLPEDTPDWVGIAIVAASVVLAAVGVFLFLKVPKAQEPAEEVLIPSEPAKVGSVSSEPAEEAAVSAEPVKKAENETNTV